MKTIKTGDFLTFTGSDSIKHTMEVRGVVDNIIFTRGVVTENDKVYFEPIKFFEIEDLITKGWIVQK